MRKELRRQIELFEQKMLKSPNNMNNGGSHFLYRRERMIRFKMLQKNMPQKMLAKRLNLTESYISKLITGERYNKDFERYIIHILDINYSCIWLILIFKWWIRHDKGGRMEKVGLNITPKEFKQLSKWSENIYNTAVVIDYFISNQPEIEECYNLAPVIKFLRNDADVLNTFFIDHEKEVKDLNAD